MIKEQSNNIELLLDDRLKEKLLKSWKDVFCFQFCVCLYIYYLHLLLSRTLQRIHYE